MQKAGPGSKKRAEAGAGVLELSGESAGGPTLSGEGVSRVRSGRRGRAKPCGGSRSLEGEGGAMRIADGVAAKCLDKSSNVLSAPNTRIKPTREAGSA